MGFKERNVGEITVRVFGTQDADNFWYEFETAELGEAAESELRMAGLAADCGMSGAPEWEWLLVVTADPRHEAAVEGIVRKYRGREARTFSCALSGYDC